MDEKIEIIKDIEKYIAFWFVTQEAITDYKAEVEEEIKKRKRAYATAFYNAGYRKESDTARDILTLIKNGVELNSMIDGDAKIAIMNELRWAGQKYGVDFTNS